MALGRLAGFKSPDQGVWYIGPFPVRAYALCILVGIVVAVWLGDRRWQQRGGQAGFVLDISAWAVPFGIVGGRLYHVITSYQAYFGPGGDPVKALYIWEGGLGIWGAVALGALGVWIAVRRKGILLPPMADTLAPGIVLAQGIGRWGNYFNNELYGGPTSLPWGLQIHEWDSAAGRAVLGADGQPLVKPGLYHPTFLYESLWDIGTAGVLLWADRRFKLGHGRVFALYVALYTTGRFWIEALRVDPANQILGLRLNLWTSVIVWVAAVVYLVVSFRTRPGRETALDRASLGPQPGLGSQLAAWWSRRSPASSSAAAGTSTSTSTTSPSGTDRSTASDGTTDHDVGDPDSAADLHGENDGATDVTPDQERADIRRE